MVKLGGFHIFVQTYISWRSPSLAEHFGLELGIRLRVRVKVKGLVKVKG
jgi:hypothetical protein